MPLHKAPSTGQLWSMCICILELFSWCVCMYAHAHAHTKYQASTSLCRNKWPRRDAYLVWWASVVQLERFVSTSFQLYWTINFGYLCCSPAVTHCGRSGLSQGEGDGCSLLSRRPWRRWQITRDTVIAIWLPLLLQELGSLGLGCYCPCDIWTEKRMSGIQCCGMS